MKIWGQTALRTKGHMAVDTLGYLLCLGLLAPLALAQEQAEGTACWVELTNQIGCYVWHLHLDEAESVTWTGKCVGGFAHGQGTLTWVEEDKSVVTASGLLQDGKHQGAWVLRWSDGSVEEGPVVDGKRHGRWVLRRPDGTVVEGAYAGQPHGHWVFRWPDGTVQEGAYVDGQPHGRWALRRSDGSAEEGAYVDGQPHGRWVLRWLDGAVAEGPVIDDKRHGRWVQRRASGTIVEESYVDGRRHGDWVQREPDGTVRKGRRYGAGRSFGPAEVLIRPDGTVERGEFGWSPIISGFTRGPCFNG